MADPILSIIIPTRDRPNLLATCLAALAKQSSSRLFDVFIGNDNRVSQISIPEDLPFKVTKTSIVGRGAVAARMACVVNARSRFLGFLDDDAIPREDWVERLISSLEAHGSRTVVTGRIEALQCSLLSRARQA